MRLPALRLPRLACRACPICGKEPEGTRRPHQGRTHRRTRRLFKQHGQIRSTCPRNLPECSPKEPAGSHRTMLPQIAKRSARFSHKWRNHIASRRNTLETEAAYKTNTDGCLPPQRPRQSSGLRAPLPPAGFSLFGAGFRPGAARREFHSATKRLEPNRRGCGTPGRCSIGTRSVAGESPCPALRPTLGTSLPNDR